MHRLTPLATLLGLQLMHMLALAGGAYYGQCYCLDPSFEQPTIDVNSTKSACEAIKHSIYYPEFGECVSAKYWGINNYCFDCLCKRTPGMYGGCDIKNGWLYKIKCGAGC